MIPSLSVQQPDVAQMGGFGGLIDKNTMPPSHEKQKDPLLGREPPNQSLEISQEPNQPPIDFSNHVATP